MGDQITAVQTMQTVTNLLPPGFKKMMRPWHTHPRETLAVGLLGAAMLALAGVSWASPSLPSYGENSVTLPIKPLPTEIRQLAPETALAVNAQIPLASGPNPAALPFSLGKASAASRARALECLTSAIYYEAAKEPTDGQRAVAQVILNRVRHPAFPNSVCGVVFEGSTRVTGCQFTFTCDGSLAYQPIRSLWNRARQVADAALNGYVFAPAGYATHYHANYVVPYWASSLTKTAVQGAHIFYRWPGGWGRPAAFTDRWTQAEGDPAKLRIAALNAPRPDPEVQLADANLQKLEEAGADVIEGKDGRVRLLFTPEAREAVEKVEVTPYVERAAASDNLRFALEGGGAVPERPFGRTTAGVGTGETPETAPTADALKASPN